MIHVQIQDEMHVLVDPFHLNAEYSISFSVYVIINVINIKVL